MDFPSSLSLSSSSSSSSSSSKRVWKYGVYLSFGSDQDANLFAHWLSFALRVADVRSSSKRHNPSETSWGNPGMIEESQIYLVVFSKSYATSTGCLRELALIFECMKEPGHSFLPIFFQVNPSNVRRWLAPCTTLLNQRPDFVIQHEEYDVRVIGEIVAEAKKILANEKDAFPMDFQSSLSSSSKWTWPWSCDVFLSFNIEDACSFVQCLSRTLNRNDFITSSWDSIIRGPLKEYKVYIAVFSKNYIHGASTQYLKELAAMAAMCINSTRHSFLPIFFEVDPSQILNSCFLKGIPELGLNLDRIVTLSIQRQDLVVRHLRDQRQVIGKIVEECMHIFNQAGSLTLLEQIDQTIQAIDKSVQIATVGIRYHRVEKLEKLLHLSSMDVVRSVGICGMGGIGKTALVEDVYNKISYLFDSTFFLTDPGKSNYQLLPEVLLRMTLQEEYLCRMDNIENSLRLRRILIVFDDVDDFKPLYDCLARRCDWFGGGSRIIITSRDEQVLKNLGVDEIHKVELLNENEALRLFCKTVFKCENPMIGYQKLTEDALKYANGLPLAIKFLGSLLRGRSALEWQDELAKLQMVPDSYVLKVLRKSFDGLRGLEKAFFLDIACCFAGQKIDFVKEILRSQSTFLDIECVIKTLIDKSLLNISHQKIEMHYMLQQLGKEIVRQESTIPGERSRIWCYEDFCHIMETNTGTEHVEVIVLLNQEYPQGTSLNIEGLSKMSRLRILIFQNVNFSGSLNCLSDNLTYLLWHKYPFTCLPSSFQPLDLKVLIMLDSCITQLWRDEKIYLWRLRTLNLSGCKNLNESPNLEFLPNLERLDLQGCTSLSQLHPSIVLLEELKFLSLRNCTSLNSIPNKLFDQSCLEYLNLAGCSKFAGCLSFDECHLSIEDTEFRELKKEEKRLTHLQDKIRRVQVLQHILKEMQH